MNQSLTRLADLYGKEERLIIGLMSGTSLDGLDIALCRLRGYGLNTEATVLEFETVGYHDEFKADVRSIFSRRQVDLEKVALLNAKVGIVHAKLINQFLKRHKISKNVIDCIASHGQTIYHAPRRLHGQEAYPNATLQIGDADHIACITGIPTISDFRQKHVAAGGEGAPLALYGDCILFSSDVENRVLLNIGGISNFTLLPKKGNNSGVICTDAGPGNMLIDSLCKKYFNVSFDNNGDIARRGEVNHDLLTLLLELPFFKEELPKTTGPELFNIGLIEKAGASLKHITPDDLIATATQFTAEAVALTIGMVLTSSPFSMYVSGGGAKNTVLMEKIASKFPGNKVGLLSELGFDGDAKEALLFAILANETICGSLLRTGAGPQVMMGKISLPH